MTHQLDTEKLARELAKEFYDDDVWDSMPPIVQANWRHVAKRASKLVLEEAAKLAESMHDEDRPGDYAYAIRALAEGVR